MKIILLIVGMAFGLGFLQHGCGNTNSNASQSPNNNQNLNVTMQVSTPQPRPNTMNSSAENKGISAEEAEELNELNERCNQAPVNSAKVAPLTGKVPLKVTFDGSTAYDPDGMKIVKWVWHFGNGESLEGKTVTYTYEKPGKYGIGLDVTDTQGHKTTDCGTGATDIEVVATESDSEENFFRY